MVGTANEYIKTKKTSSKYLHLKIGYLLSVLEQTMCGIEFHSLWS